MEKEQLIKIEEIASKINKLADIKNQISQKEIICVFNYETGPHPLRDPLDLEYINNRLCEFGVDIIEKTKKELKKKILEEIDIKILYLYNEIVFLPLKKEEEKSKEK